MLLFLNLLLLLLTYINRITVEFKFENAGMKYIHAVDINRITVEFKSDHNTVTSSKPFHINRITVEFK